MGSLAPHEYNEVKLVLSGVKPLATIEKEKDPIGYALAISLNSAGMLYAECIPSVDSPYGEVVVTTRANRNLAAEFKRLQEHGVRQFGIKEYHRRIGELYGYTQADIESFIAADIHCECTKCKGR